MPKPPVNAKQNAKKGKKTASNFPKKLVLIGCFIVLISILLFYGQVYLKLILLKGKSGCYRSHQVRPILVLLISLAKENKNPFPNCT